MFFLLFAAKAIITAIAATAVVATIATIAYAVITEWYEPLTVSTDTVEAFKRELENSVIVTIGIRDNKGILKHQKDFEGDALADDLKSKFAGRDSIILKG